MYVRGSQWASSCPGAAYSGQYLHCFTSIIFSDRSLTQVHSVSPAPPPPFSDGASDRDTGGCVSLWRAVYLGYDGVDFKVGSVVEQEGRYRAVRSATAAWTWRSLTSNHYYSTAVPTIPTLH